MADEGQPPRRLHTWPASTAKAEKPMAMALVTMALLGMVTSAQRPPALKSVQSRIRPVTPWRASSWDEAVVGRGALLITSGAGMGAPGVPGRAKVVIVVVVLVSGLVMAMSVEDWGVGMAVTSRARREMEERRMVRSCIFGRVSFGFSFGEKKFVDGKKDEEKRRETVINSRKSEKKMIEMYCTKRLKMQ